MKYRSPRVSLHTKIIAWAFVPTALVLGLVALVNFRAYQRVVQDLVVQSNRERVRLLAWQLGDEMDGYRAVLEELASSMVIDTPNALSRRVLLSQSSSLPEIFDEGVILLNQQGKVIDGIARGSRFIGDDWSKTGIYLQTLMHNQPRSAISDLVLWSENKENLLAISAPISSSQDTLLGLVVGMIHLQGAQPDLLDTAVAHLHLNFQGLLYVVDGNGRVLYHTLPRYLGQDFYSREVVREVVVGKVGSRRIQQSIEGHQSDTVVSYAPIPGTRWGLVIEEDWVVLIASSGAYTWFLLALLVLGVLLPAGIVTSGVRRITRPITALTLAAQAVAEGHFGQTIEADSGDEVEALAGQFNRMSLQLQESYATLEGRVAARTRELQTLNAVASVVSSATDLDDLLVSALERTMVAMSMPAGAVLLRDGEGGLYLAVQHGLSAEFQRTIAHLPAGVGACGEATRRGEPAFRSLEDYSEENLRQSLEQEGLGYTASIPLLSKGEALGSLNLCSPQKRSFSAEEIQMLASIGSHIGVAIENARLHSQREQMAVAAERSRLARELHDAVTQTLFSASLIADVLPRLWERSPQEGRRRLEELRLLNRGALAEMRTLLLELRPSALEEAELPELLRHLINAFTARTRLAVEFEDHSSPVAEIPPIVKMTFYRIAQEGLNNIARHACAQRVSLHLNGGPGQVVLDLRDDGCGFNLAQIPSGHLGVAIMRERAESAGMRLDISTQAGEGTHLRLAWIPGESISLS